MILEQLSPNITIVFKVPFLWLCVFAEVDTLFYVVSNQKHDIGTNQRPVFGNLQISTIIHLSSNRKLYLQTNLTPSIFNCCKVLSSFIVSPKHINCLARSLVKKFIVLREVHNTYTLSEERRDWNI